MAWESRQRGGRYYVRSVRRDGRVAKEYVGAGLVGELAATLDAADRREREAKRRERREEQARHEALEEQVKGVCEAAELWARIALLAAGYHRHERGEWRKRRGEPSSG
jgi:hypothetical protein